MESLHEDRRNRPGGDQAHCAHGCQWPTRHGFKPTVLAATPDDGLRWLGKLGFGGIVDGEHFFILDGVADGTTHVTHGERYSGALVALSKPLLSKERSQAGYERFNRVLKQRAESLQGER